MRKWIFETASYSIYRCKKNYTSYLFSRDNHTQCIVFFSLCVVLLSVYMTHSFGSFFFSVYFWLSMGASEWAKTREGENSWYTYSESRCWNVNNGAWRNLSSFEQWHYSPPSFVGGATSELLLLNYTNIFVLASFLFWFLWNWAFYFRFNMPTRFF